MYGTVARQFPYNEDDHHTASSSDSSTDFPFRPFVSLLSPDDPNTKLNEQSPNDTLPSLKDRSWIGARMSPILNDNDDGNNDSVHQHHHQQQLQQADDYYYSQLPAPSSSQQQQPQHQYLHHYHSSLLLNHGIRKPSAGHHRSEYPAFGIHPLQNTSMMLLQQKQQNRQLQRKQVWEYFGTYVCLISGLCLLGMGLYDAFCIKYVATEEEQDSHSTTSSSRNDHTWSLPWGQPSYATSVAWGGLMPSSILLNGAPTSAASSSWWITYVQYGRIVTSAIQSNSIVEWLLLSFGWFICSRTSAQCISISTVATVYMISILTGQLWMMATWWLTAQPLDYYSYYQYQQTPNMVAHCTAWGTCGVLCFVGMVRPQRRFGCFMICIGLVLLTLFQAEWTLSTDGSNSKEGETSQQQPSRVSNPLPLVVGCTIGAFVGWALYGSQMIGMTAYGCAVANNNNLLLLEPYNPILSLGITMQQQRNSFRPQVHPGVRLLCAVCVVMAWILPLLILAYYDYYYFYYGEGHSSVAYATTSGGDVS